LAGLVRAHAPNLVYERGERELPVDWRRCRRPECAAAPDDPALDAHVPDGRARDRRPRAGRPDGRSGRATAFTHLIRRRGRLYLQYWLYYPDSDTFLGGSHRAWERSWLLPRIRKLVDGSSDYPGFHRDDWEGVFLRIDPDGSTWTRASSHGHFQSCKWRACHDDWVRSTGWARVSRGSHSGHVPFRSEPAWREIGRRARGGYNPLTRGYLPLTGPPRRIPLVPGRDLDERTTTGEGLRLIPLETRDRRRYRPLDREVEPPWRKRAYADPESGES
jgi:hypothetical protein